MNKKQTVFEILKQNKADAILLFSTENRYWFSQFKSSMGYLLITQNQTYLFLDGRYLTMAKTNLELKNVDQILHLNKDFWKTLNEILIENQVQNLGFESDWIKYQQYLNFKSALPNQNLVPIDTSKMRMIKEKWEVEQIKTATQITNRVFEAVLKFVKPGMTEKDIERFVSDKFFEYGADKLSFDTIVASGINGSKPHAVPTNKVLKQGELITLDMGCFYNGYCSDQTRTFVLGNQLDSKLQDIYDTVYEAQSLGISLVKNGMNAGDIHRQVEKFIASKGYEGYFDHGLGHGIGVEIHEEPYENYASQTILKTGMTITVEPGIYIPGVGGARIEDDLLVTNDGYEMLTISPRELIKVNN